MSYSTLRLTHKFGPCRFKDAKDALTLTVHMSNSARLEEIEDAREILSRVRAQNQGTQGQGLVPKVRYCAQRANHYPDSALDPSITFFNTYTCIPTPRDPAEASGGSLWYAHQVPDLTTSSIHAFMARS